MDYLGQQPSLDHESRIPDQRRQLVPLDDGLVHADGRGMFAAEVIEGDQPAAQVHRRGSGDGKRGGLSLFEGDEVATDAAAGVVVLDHRQLFGHVDGQVVVGSRSASATFPPNRGKVLAFRKSILSDALLDPGGEVAADAEGGVQVAGVTEWSGLSCESADEYRHQIGGGHGNDPLRAVCFSAFPSPNGWAEPCGVGEPVRGPADPKVSPHGPPIGDAMRRT